VRRALSAVFIMMALVFCVPAAHAKPVVAFGGLRPSYVAGQQISFVVKSLTKRAVLFSCTAELRRGVQWDEVLYSVNGNPQSKSVPLLPLKSRSSTQRVTWDTAATKLYAPAGVYRLKTEVYEASGRHRHLATNVSAPFRIGAK
jgi:hypothetical protein